MQKIENNIINKQNNGHKYVKQSRSNSASVKFANTNLKEKLSDKEKKLTAKYSNHELMLIKNRLNLEMWLDERLNDLYELTNDDTHEIQTHDLYSDDLVDHLIKLDTDFDRKIYLVKQLENAKKSQEIINLFIGELLIRLNML